MSALGFLSAPGAGGVVELRGEHGAFAGERIARLTPTRAVALTDDASALVERARASGLRAYDLSAGWTALRIADETVLRRLTDVVPDRPTAAPVARGVGALLFPRDGGWDVLVPQELGAYVRDVVADLERGLA